MAGNNIGGADPKFPGDAEIAPPSTNRGSGATRENPGDVHPSTDPSLGGYPPETAQGQKGPSIFNSIENPFLLRESLTKLESALDEVVGVFAREGTTLSKEGDFTQGKQAIDKFRQWRDELEKIKAGQE